MQTKLVEESDYILLIDSLYKNNELIQARKYYQKGLIEFKNNSDLLFHSCGMDKRPSSIFGGYVHIKKKHENYGIWL